MVRVVVVRELHLSKSAARQHLTPFRALQLMDLLVEPGAQLAVVVEAELALQAQIPAVARVSRCGVSRLLAAEADGLGAPVGLAEAVLPEAASIPPQMRVRPVQMG